MRFMMLMIPKVYQPGVAEGENPGFAPDPESVKRMMEYNERLARAGALIALDGLRPPADAARVSFREGKTTVTDGPYAEAKEVLGGYWVIQVKSREEAIEWARQCPAGDGDVIEVRQIFDIEDMPPETQAAGKSEIVARAGAGHRKGSVG
ncbi:YciI family protein [Salinispira pacifica]